MPFDNLTQLGHQIHEGLVQNYSKYELGEGQNLTVDQFRQQYAWTAQIYQPFTNLPDPASFDPLVNELHQAMSSVSQGSSGQKNPLNNRDDVYFANPELAAMTTSGGYIDDWTGDAAESFKRTFIDPFPNTTTNQFIALACLKGTLEAYQALWQAARNDISHIAHSTLDAIDNAHGCSKNDWTMAFAVMTAIASVGSLGLAAAGAAAAFSAVGAASALGNVGKATMDVSGGGDKSADIANSMKAAIEKLEQSITQQEAKIDKAISGMTGFISGHRHLFVAKRPALAGMHGGTLTSDKGMGHAQ